MMTIPVFFAIAIPLCMFGLGVLVGVRISRR